MDRIKSALEKAMERAEQMEAPTEEERLEWKWAPEGTKLATAFLNSKVELAAEVAKVQQPARRFLMKGIADVLLENLRLPRSEHAFKTNERILEVLKQLSQGPMGEIADRFRYVFTQYAQFHPQQQQEAYDQLKEQMQTQLEQAIQQQPGTQRPVSPGNIEATPEFQTQWLRTIAQLEEPYEEHLRDFRRQIRALL